MEPYFNYFADIIPQETYSRTKAHSCRYMVIFEPEGYAVGEVFRTEDYHFMLFFGRAPVTRINTMDYHLKKGDLLVVQPREEVYGVPDDKREHGKYIHIAVKKAFFHEVSAEIAGEKAFQFKRVQSNYSKQLLDLVGNFQLELMNYGETYPQMMHSLSTQIVFQLIRDLSMDNAKNKEKMGKDNQYISKAILFMQEYYHANISINDICSLIYLSPCHFKRVFKEYTGQTPYQYLVGIRLEKARELLRAKEHSIEDTAKRCGFVNSGHFAVAFKRNVKMSPSEYRKMHEKYKI